MKMNRTLDTSLLVAFIVNETALCISVQMTTGTPLVIVSFLSVVLAFLFSLIRIRRDYNHILTTIGLLMTVGADVFLVVLNPQIPVLAMGFFSVTQICYFIRIYLNQETERSRKVKRMP